MHLKQKKPMQRCILYHSSLIEREANTFVESRLLAKCLEIPWWLRWQSLPAMQETEFDPWGPLEKKGVTHSSILTWKIPWMEDPGGPQSIGSQGIRHN